MSSDPQAHITSQQAITQPAVSSMRPASESGHASTSSATAADPPQPAVTALSATSSGPRPDHAESAVQPQPTPSGVTTSFNKPVPSPPVPQITTVSLPMSVPRPGYHSGEEHQQSEPFTSSPHPIISSPAHTLGSSEVAVMGGDTPSAQSTTSILIPAPASQAHPLAATVSTSAPPPGPVTAAPIFPSTSPTSIGASGPAQSHFHASGPGTAGSAFTGPSRQSTQEFIQGSASEHQDERKDGNALAQVHAPAHGYKHPSAPVAGPSGQTNAVHQTQSLRTPTPQELPSSGPAHPRGPDMHMSMGDNRNGAGIGAGYAGGATNGHNASALGNREGQRRQNSSPGPRTSTRTVSYTDAPLPSRAVDRYPMPMTNPNQPVPTAGVSKSLPLPPPVHHGSGGDPVMSPQAGASMPPYSDLDWTVPYMSGSHPAGHGNGMGMQGMPGGIGATGGRPGSRHESRRGSAYMGNGNGGGNGNASAHHRSIDGWSARALRALGGA
ncbi:hypothetical protein LXA43DRAFT_1062550 [Ganoderma leucocontextum]|nr:hypothetical protein LXA43DRAFT_1062550 [Ganoderma leucocontextum]